MVRAGARRVSRAVISAGAPAAPSGPSPAGEVPAAEAPAGEVPAGEVPAGEVAAGGVRARAGTGAGGPAAGRPAVLFAGRLAAQKGLAVLLDAAASWQDLDPRPRLLIAGDGPLAARLRDQARDRGIDAAFLGRVGDVPALIAGAAVFVLPSWWEGQPLALQEALRAGRPVVASRAGGIPALTGEDGALLVPPGDAAALGAAVRAVLTDPALAARLAAAAASRGARLPSEADALAAARAAYATARSGGAADRPRPVCDT
jgi:glycosyltransferase involved in cell wall biosynthesis